MPVSAVIVAATCIMRSPSLSTALVIQFTTGNVATDFPQGPRVYVASDPTNDLFFAHTGANHGTGWNVFDIRFAYDAASDTAFFGEVARALPAGPRTTSTP